MKQASLVIEACFIRQRSLLRWALKQASFFSMIFKQKMTQQGTEVLKFRVIRTIRVRQLNRETQTICFQITYKKAN